MNLGDNSDDEIVDFESPSEHEQPSASACCRTVLFKAELPLKCFDLESDINRRRVLALLSRPQSNTQAARKRQREAVDDRPFFPNSKVSNDRLETPPAPTLSQEHPSPPAFVGHSTLPDVVGDERFKTERPTASEIHVVPESPVHFDLEESGQSSSRLHAHLPMTPPSGIESNNWSHLPESEQQLPSPDIPARPEERALEYIKYCTPENPYGMWEGLARRLNVDCPKSFLRKPDYPTRFLCPEVSEEALSAFYDNVPKRKPRWPGETVGPNISIDYRVGMNWDDCIPKEEQRVLDATELAAISERLEEEDDDNNAGQSLHDGGTALHSHSASAGNASHKPPRTYFAQGLSDTVEQYAFPPLSPQLHDASTYEPYHSGHQDLVYTASSFLPHEVKSYLSSPANLPKHPLVGTEGALAWDDSLDVKHPSRPLWNESEFRRYAEEPEVQELDVSVNPAEKEGKLEDDFDGDLEGLTRRLADVSARGAPWRFKTYDPCLETLDNLSRGLATHEGCEVRYTLDYQGVSSYIQLKRQCGFAFLAESQQLLFMAALRLKSFPIGTLQPPSTTWMMRLTLAGKEHISEPSRLLELPKPQLQRSLRSVTPPTPDIEFDLSPLGGKDESIQLFGTVSHYHSPQQQPQPDLHLPQLKDFNPTVNILVPGFTSMLSSEEAAYSPAKSTNFFPLSDQTRQFLLS